MMVNYIFSSSYIWSIWISISIRNGGMLSKSNPTQKYNSLWEYDGFAQTSNNPNETLVTEKHT